MTALTHQLSLHNRLIYFSLFLEFAGATIANLGFWTALFLLSSWPPSNISHSRTQKNIHSIVAVAVAVATYRQCMKYKALHPF